ncbi:MULTISPECIES: M15 family metallopeptidase [Rheinheimera]|uniref:M15 family metallopeptidase n=1 Tax=Rheinheimera TaxID=67575 RepID=UPI001043508F|nr:M15 family metallopeptidase [Rheinheimera sp. D18]QBL10500.1 peptidase M15 [Rheinheimera sp. D18]
MKLATLATLLLATSSTAALASDVPADFNDVSQLSADIQVHMAYLGGNNFVGAPVDGYKANKCYLQQNAAKALVKVQQAAMANGYSLWIWDCYRPQRAVDHFMRWAADLADTSTKAEFYPNLAKDTLVGGYIAEKSGHSRGSTVDLTLARQNASGQWQPIDMGSPFDLFDPISNVGAASITKRQQEHRQLLESLMLSAGFKVYNMEWWHFTHQPPVYTEQYFDFVIQ